MKYVCDVCGWEYDEEQRFLPLPVLRQHDESGRRLMQLWVGSNGGKCWFAGNSQRVSNNRR